MTLNASAIYDLLLRIVAQVDNLDGIEALKEQLNQFSPALDTISARAKEALNPMNALGTSAENFGERAKSATQPLADLATNTLKVTAVISALATALGGAVYQEAVKFESAQLGLQKVLDGTQAELAGYSKELNSLAREFGVSGTALTASMADFVQAGFSASEAMDLVRQSLKLKVAGDLEAAESSDVLVRTLKGFKAEASEASRYVDVLNEVSNKYATDVKQLAEGMMRVAPIAKTMGLSFEETASLLTPMIESFGSGAEAAEAFKTGVAKLIDDSAPVQSALNSIGVAQTDLNGSLRSGKDILNDVLLAFRSADENQKLFLTTQLVGIDQAPRMIEVFNNLEKVLQIQKTALDATGSAQKEVNIRLDSAEISGNRAAESFRQLAVVLGTQYKEEVKGVIDATGELARRFIEVEETGALNGLFEAVRPQLAAVENLFRQMAKNLPAAFEGLDFSPLTSAIVDLGGEVSEAFKKLIGGIDLTSVEGLRTLLQLIADGMAALIRFTAGAIEQMGPFFTLLGKMAVFAADNADSISRLAGEVAGFGFTVNQLLPLLADMVGGVFKVVGQVAEAALQIGLLVGAIKLLNLAGINVLPLLGQFAAAIGGLGITTATVGAAFAGFPGIILALGAAAGTAGYGVGTLLSKGIDTAAETLTGTSLGGLIYELAEYLGLENTESERAKINQDALARAREAQAEAAKKAAEAADQKRIADEKANAAADAATRNTIAANQAIDRLAAGFQAAGLIWNKETGELVRVGDAIKGLAPASLTVINSLRDLGVDYAQFTNGISEGGTKAVQAFKKLTEDATANSPIVASALEAALRKAETVGDVQAIESAFNKFAASGKLSSEQIAEGQRLLAEKLRDTLQAADPIQRAMNGLIADQNQYADATEKAVKAQLAAIDSDIALARAKGHTATVQRLTIERTLVEAEGALRMAKANQVIQESEYALAVVKRNQLDAIQNKTAAQQQELAIAELTVQKELAEAQAAGINAQAQEVLFQKLQKLNGISGGVTAGTQQNTQATAENTNATQQNNQQQEKRTGLLETMVSALNNARQRTNELSEATGRLFELLFTKMELGEATVASPALRQYAISLNALKDQYSDLRQKISDFQAQIKAADADILNGVNSVSRYFGYVAKAEAEASLAFYEQKLQAEQLSDSLERMADKGIQGYRGLETAMANLDRTTVNLQNDFSLLDQQQLEELQSQIDATREKLKEMADETQSAKDRLAELNAELLEAQGQDQKAKLLREQLDYQQQLAEIETQRAEAEAMGNRELLGILDKQRAVLEEIHATKLKNIQADAAAADASTRTTATLTTLANEAERAHRATKNLASVDMSHLASSAEQVKASFTAIRGLM